MRSQPAANSQSHALRGVLWMLGAVLSFAVMAVAVRELLRHVGILEILALRTLVTLLLVSTITLRRGFAPLRTRRFPTHAARAVLHLAGQFCWMYAIGALPLAMAAAAPGWVAPALADLPWILAIGAGSFAAHYSMTRAMKLADATVVVPIDFVRLPLIAVVGALFYAEPFDPMVIVGAAVIFVGTYYSLSRERR